MGDPDSPTVSVSLWSHGYSSSSESGSIDYVSVHDRRVLAIYQTAIFNVTTDPAQISNAQTLTIECWETPIQSHADDRSKQELVQDFTDVFDSVEGIESITSIARPD